MGEFEAFSKGTFDIADTLAELTGKGCTTIIGGGDSVAAVEKAGLAEKMSHIDRRRRLARAARGQGAPGRRRAAGGLSSSGFFECVECATCPRARISVACAHCAMSRRIGFSGARCAWYICIYAHTE